MNFLTSLFKKPVVEQDKLSGHYIAYYKDDLGIVSQGSTKAEALKNLREDIKMINDLKNNVSAKHRPGTKHRVAHS